MVYLTKRGNEIKLIRTITGENNNNSINIMLKKFLKVLKNYILSFTFSRSISVKKIKKTARKIKTQNFKGNISPRYCMLRT